jgi:hypothetical protein
MSSSDYSLDHHLIVVVACLGHWFTLDESTPALGTRKKHPNFVVCLTVYLSLVHIHGLVSWFLLRMMLEWHAVLVWLMIPWHVPSGSFRPVEDVFLGTCAREIEWEALSSSPVGGDHGRAPVAADNGWRPAPPPRHTRALLLGPPCLLY